MSASVLSSYILSFIIIVTGYFSPLSGFTAPSTGELVPISNDWTTLYDDDGLPIGNNLHLHTFVGHQPHSNSNGGSSATDNLESLDSKIGNEENSAKMRFYYNSINNFTEFPLSQAQNILSSSWYDPSKMTFIFTHGYTGHPKGPAVTSVINFFLEERKFNVALLNWDRMAAMVHPNFVNSYLNWAAPNAIKVGAKFAETLLNLSAAGVDLNKIHLVGHSLGAHVFGVAGNKILEKGVLLPWITGLDPSSVAFDNKPPAQRLHPRSAGFVSVIHSDPNKYGSKKELGTVDFWPNFRNLGQVTQVGCSSGPHPRFSQEDLCNHNRSWQLLIDAQRYPGTLIGSYAKNFRTWKNYSKDERNTNVLEIGTYNPNAKPGNYYFVTAGDSPYGLGKNGL